MHKKFMVSSFSDRPFDHRGFPMPPTPEQLYNHVQKTFPDLEVALTYEAGCCGFSAARSAILMTPRETKEFESILCGDLLLFFGQGYIGRH